MKRISVIALSLLLLVALAIPAMSADLELDITSVALKKMTDEGGSVWYVQPGTYQGF